MRRPRTRNHQHHEATHESEAAEAEYLFSAPPMEPQGVEEAIVVLFALRRWRAGVAVRDTRIDADWCRFGRRLTYHDSTSMFKDVMKMANDGWDVVKAASPTWPWSISGVPKPAMDLNGYPIGLGNLPSQGYALDMFVFTHNGGIYPIGVYTLTFDGDGTVEIINGNQPAQVFSQAGGSGSPSNVYINSTNNNGIVIVITSSNASDYVKNIRLVMPGFQNSYLSEPFNPAFLSEFEPMQQVRMMGLMGLNNTSTQNVGLTWADYTPATYFTQATPTGVNVEYLVDLANVLQENMWVNIPVGADSSFVTNFAQYVEQNLDSNLKVYVEYGNEVWNRVYSSEWSYVNKYAVANNSLFFKPTRFLLPTPGMSCGCSCWSDRSRPACGGESIRRALEF